jgi:serine/threonine protein kinase
MPERKVSPVIQCPTCKKTWEDNVRFCPEDGTPLSDTAAAQNDAPTPTAVGRPRSVQLKLPTVVGARYRLDEVRGGGGMAKVYKGFDLNLQREVAVKLINPELRNDPEFDARFHREARIAGGLADPHIVVVHDSGIDPELGPFLVMEFLVGQSLRERLHSDGPLPLKAGLQIAGQIMLALIHAHGKGIVHRDIKPDNIFLLHQSGVRLHIRVLDFGIARIMKRDDPAAGHTLTAAGSALGTPRYMSPEQLSALPDVDARTDIYSAALVIFEMLTGQLPSLTSKRLTELCPDASPELQELLEQCLKPDRNERPPTSIEVYLRLQELGKASGVLLLPPGAMESLVAQRRTTIQQATTQTYPKQTPSRIRLHRRGLLIGVVALVLLLGGLTALLVYFKWSGGAKGGDRETLLGIQVGDPQDEVEQKLALSSSRDGDPRKDRKLRHLLGPFLAQNDDLSRVLKLGDKGFDAVQTRWTKDEDVCGVFVESKLRILVVRKRKASTGKGLAMHADYSQIGKYYHQYFQRRIETPEGKNEAPVCIQYNDKLGLAIEFSTVKEGGEPEPSEIIALILYPPTE